MIIYILKNFIKLIKFNYLKNNGLVNNINKKLILNYLFKSVNNSIVLN